ncbi:hypothetical protein HDU76_008747, partial [Blyttiomyces sp. JEL0837]
MLSTTENQHRVVAQSPAQSPLLASQGVPAPPSLLHGQVGLHDLIVAESYRKRVLHELSKGHALETDVAAARLYLTEVTISKSRGFQNHLINTITPIIKSLTSPLTAKLDNIKIRYHNERAVVPPGAHLRPVVKEVEGHPGFVPKDPALVDLDVPVPIGTCLPVLSFFGEGGVTLDEIENFTEGQIADLGWFYNRGFE